MKTTNIVGDSRIRAKDGREIEVLDPATDELVATVPDSGPTETIAAVDAAAKAFETWRLVPVSERAAITRRFAESIVADRERIAGIIHIGTETSQPPERPRPDIEAMTSWLSE